MSDLHTLLDSLTDGDHTKARGFLSLLLRTREGRLHSALHSVTVRRTVVQRWERGDNE